MSIKEICSTDKCTGCCTCYNLCPKQCITMTENEFGFITPKIDKDKCIECSLCIKSCPANNESKFYKPEEAYAVWNLNDEDRAESSSGGPAVVFSRKIIRNGGSVFASRYDKKLNLENKLIELDEEVDYIKGSKYFQSYIGDSYKKVKEKLDENKKVLFIGTPCQVDGLNFFLKKEYENLVTVDFICHGVPPMRYFKEYISELEKKFKKNITDVKFRGKDDYKLAVYSGDKKIYLRDCNEDLYYLGFIRGLYHRQSCHTCKYAQVNRISDLTVGDFWGLEDLNLKERGVERAAVVFPNTDKGKKFFETCKENLFSVKRSIEELRVKNEQLRHPIRVHEKDELFKTYYTKYGFKKAANKCLRRIIITRKIKSKIKAVLGIFIKKYRK